MQAYLMTKNQGMEDAVPFTLNSIKPTTNPQRGPLQIYIKKVMTESLNQETNDGKKERLLYYMRSTFSSNLRTNQNQLLSTFGTTSL